LTNKVLLEVNSIRPEFADNETTVAGQIMTKLLSSGSIGHRQTVKMEIRLDWNPQLFCEQRGYDADYDEFLERAVVLIGTGNDAQFTTVSEYMH
jgi:hypothetical protein